MNKQSALKNRGGPRTARTVEVQEKILNASTSTITRNLGPILLPKNTLLPPRLIVQHCHEFFLD
jgi:hypothetical protein